MPLLKLNGPTSLLLVDMADGYWAYVILKKTVFPFKTLRLPDTSAVAVTLFSILELQMPGTTEFWRLICKVRDIYCPPLCKYKYIILILFYWLSLSVGWLLVLLFLFYLMFVWLLLIMLILIVEYLFNLIIRIRPVSWIHVSLFYPLIFQTISPLNEPFIIF